MTIRIDNIGSGGGGTAILELGADPASPQPNDVWVLRSAGSTGTQGTPLGLLLTILRETVVSSGVTTYQLSFRNSAGGTVRVTLA